MMRTRASLSAKMAEFETLCRQNGIPLTVQRRVILKALLHRHDHPTADQIAEDVAILLPGVSRTTVYRVLETLVRINLARKVCHPGAAARFEVESHRHHHLICIQCGRMIDLDDPRLDNLPFPDAVIHDFELTDYSIQFRGTCADCVGAVAAPEHSTSLRKGHKEKKRSQAVNKKTS